MHHSSNLRRHCKTLLVIAGALSAPHNSLALSRRRGLDQSISGANSRAWSFLHAAALLSSEGDCLLWGGPNSERQLPLWVGSSPSAR